MAFLAFGNPYLVDLLATQLFEEVFLATKYGVADKGNTGGGGVFFGFIV